VTGGHRLAGGDLTSWVRVRLAEAATWREVVYTATLAAVVPVAYAALALLAMLDVALVASPWLASAGPVSLGLVEVHTAGQAVPYTLLGVAVLPLWAYLVGLVAAGQAAIARVLLGGDRSATALQEVARSRARLADAYDAERRRIERDLHDGAQHRLTSLTLHLGMARLDVPAGSPAAATLAVAHEQAKELMVVLRNTVHGIHPRTLTDLGLPGAVRKLAAQLPVPVTVTAPQPWPGRLPERVESSAYFAVAEALTNVVKHSKATRAQVTMSRTGALLVMEVQDDGTGGADPARGTGLTGLSDRVAAAGGRLLLASPAGGPTLVRVELPCDK
jgi:signal transduction histidine kinase